MPDLKAELKQIADDVNAYIRGDAFPEHIFPDHLRSAVRAYPMMGGKRLRPALLLWCCGAFGGSLRTALPAAAAVEIYHNWTLVHDDIIDEDDTRRGVPTTHCELARYASTAFQTDAAGARKFGSDFAILAGDLQQAWSVHAMLGLLNNGVPPALVLLIVRRLEENLARGLISGEALDVDLARRKPENISEDTVLRMIAGKTGAILRFASQTGAVLALQEPNFERREIRRIGEFADALAIAFQLRDDHLGIFGDEKTFGKPLCSDFKESKPTILFLTAYKRGNEEQKKELLSLLGHAVYTESEQARIRALLTETGAKEENLRRIAVCSDTAREVLGELPANRYRILLEELTEQLIGRSV